MKKFFSTSVATLSIGVAAGATWADASNGPIDAAAPVPSANYQSPFAGYRALGADQVTAWKDANDTVKNIGGWRAYATEAAKAAKATAAKSKPAVVPQQLSPSPESAAPAKVPAPQHKH